MFFCCFSAAVLSLFLCDSLFSIAYGFFFVNNISKKIFYNFYSLFYSNFALSKIYEPEPYYAVQNIQV